MPGNVPGVHVFGTLGTLLPTIRSRCPCFWGHWEHFISDGVQGGAKSGICLGLEDFHFGKLEEEGFAAELLKLHNGLEV